MAKEKGFFNKVGTSIKKIHRETFRVLDQALGLGNKAIETTRLDKILGGGSIGASTSSGSGGGHNVHYTPPNSSTSIGFGISNNTRAPSLFVNNQATMPLTTPPAKFAIQSVGNKIAERDQLLREIKGPGYIPESSLATMGAIAIAHAATQLAFDTAEFVDTWASIYSVNDSDRSEALNRNMNRAANMAQSMSQLVSNPSMIPIYYTKHTQEAANAFATAYEVGNLTDAGAAAGHIVYDVGNAAALTIGVVNFTSTTAANAGKHVNNFAATHKFRSPMTFQFDYAKLNSGIPLDVLKPRNPIVKKPDLLDNDFVTSGHPDLGSIELSLLKSRYRLLEKNGLLENRARITIGMETGSKGRTVFRNRHLYDPHFVRKNGLTNLEAMKLEGWAPIGYDGNTVNVIHHFEQKHDGAWVVIPETFHIQNTKLLHSTPRPIGGVNRSKYGAQRVQFWKSEAADIIAELNETINVNVTHGPKL